MTALGEKLAAARRARGWTLRDVEHRTGVHNAHLSQIEKGGIERPAPNVLWTLAQVFELDYQELLRLAGHIERASSSGAATASPVAAALRALGDLSAQQQEEVLQYIEGIRKENPPERS